jgi:hypothetical protein
LGFEEMSFADGTVVGTDYCGKLVVERWLRTSILMANWVKQAVDKQLNRTATEENAAYWNGQLTAVIQSFGIELPKLYERSLAKITIRQNTSRVK